MSHTCQLIRPSQWNRPRLKQLLDAFRKKRVLILGDLGVDRYTFGSVERISPEAPVPIVSVFEERLKLGLAANVADNVKALQGEPLAVGLIGKDRNSLDFRFLLSQAGISARYLITDSKRRTTLKERIVSESQQLLRVDYETLQKVEPALEQKILDRAFSAMQIADAIILEDYAKGLMNPIMARRIYKKAKALGKSVLVDPNAKSPLQLYIGAGILTPNKKEAEALAGIPIVDERSLVEAGRRILKDTGAVHVVITRGKDGMAIGSKNEKTFRLIPTCAQEVFDVSGAGDTVISVLALALSAGATIEEACILGNLAAGVEVGKRGTATVTIDEIIGAMDYFSI